jgi:DNA-binding CsgD family transcriptional regulator
MYSNDKALIDFILSEMPLGVIAINEKLSIIYQNSTAGKFISRYEIPEEITTICRRIFAAIRAGNVNELFPGDIILCRKIDKAPNNWTFRLHICKGASPFVNVFMTEEKVSNKLDLNEIRMQFKLTRRETDVVRRVLDGLRNNDISEDLGITEQTVKDHLSNIYIKCRVENRFGLICHLMSSQEQVNPTPYFGRIDAL